MRYKYLMLPLLFLFAFAGEVQADGREFFMWVKMSPTAGYRDGIPYARNRPLTYADFQEKIKNPEVSGIAYVDLSLTVKYRVERRGLRSEGFVTVFVGMYPAGSWMKESARNPSLLQHEQRHFDIAALWACKLKSVLDTTRFELDRYRQQIQTIQQRHEELWQEEELRYDRETRHGIDREMQAKWDAEIDRRLREQVCFQ